MKTIGKQVIEEDFDWGVYVAQLPTGEVIADDDGNFLLVQCKKGDPSMIKQLREAAKYYGFAEIIPRFLPGRRMVSDEEFEEQRLRQLFGMVPDPLDAGNLKDMQRRGIV